MSYWQYLRGMILALSLISTQGLAQQDLTFNVHSNTPPFEWQNEAGEETGFNIELARQIAQKLQYDLIINRQTLEQTLYSVTQKTRQLAVIDLPAGETFALSTALPLLPLLPTYISAYNRRTEGQADSWAALRKKRVAIKQASSVDMYLKANPQDFILVPVVTNEQGFELLSAGEVDFVLAEFYCARRLLQLFPMTKTASNPLFFSQFYLVMSDKDPAFSKAVSDVLEQNYHGGYFDDLIDKWVGFGKEKIELGQVRNNLFQGALLAAIVSSIGMLITLYISLVLRQKTQSLKRELSQRQKAEAEISRVSTQFHSVLDGLPCGVILLDQHQQIIWQNGKYQRMLEPERLKQAYPKVALTQLIQSGFNGEDSQLIEFSLDNKRWKLNLYLISSNMLALFIEDYTEPFELKQASELSSRLASLGELTTGIAHEINNPVGLINQSMSLMQDIIDDLQRALPLADTQPQALQQGFEELNYTSQSVQESAERIGCIIHDLKHFSRYGLNNVKPVALNHIVETALRLTHNSVKRLQLQLSLHPKLPAIKGDELQLQLVLINLIQNACLAMDKTNPLLTIETGVEEGQVYLKVIDNGCGMQPHIQARIREPFFTTRREQGGTGLGLSTTNKILVEHGAQWLIHSQPNIGTEMKILLGMNNET
ncbi:transporter substrate-binding domain-containing protein [Brenneria goodwinii]|uniref:ATP-binding protein n=1 Tax=Brenneria goodwinii TaxID=1109412 RepID=UPI0036E1F11B